MLTKKYRAGITYWFPMSNSFLFNRIGLTTCVPIVDHKILIDFGDILLF